MKTFKTIRSTKFTSKNINAYCTIDKVRKEGTNRIFFVVRNEEGKNVVSTMFARKYDAEKIVKNWFNYLQTKN